MNNYKNQPVKTDPKNNYQKKAKITEAQILNKAPSDRQITAEQLLREAYDHRFDEIKQPILKITNDQELKSYQLRKRVEFEEKLRKQPHSINCWLRYAAWEETQQEWERVRSIFERALNIDYQNCTIWLKYTEFEMKNKFVNHARNVWDRAVLLLPRVDQLWYKYALMEEKLGSQDKARTVFERWMKWNPPANAWESYIKLEMRCGGKRNLKVERARKIWKRFVIADESLTSYLKWAKFEEKYGEDEDARNVYTTALRELGEEAYDIKFFTAFAEFEKKEKETERARAIYKFALDHIPKHLAERLYKEYTAFEKQHGERKSIDQLIFSKKRFFYEERLKSNPSNYDTWFDYLKLEEESGDKEKTCDLYERAIAVVPPVAEKHYWARYVFLWLRYAFYAETRGRDPARAREIYKQVLNLVPHKKFTFAKLWLSFAKFEIRQMNLAEARKILGQALGLCPKQRIFLGYIEIEMKLLKMNRCRKLYEKMLQHGPENCDSWHRYAAMEAAIGENERARAIFELGVAQPVLDMPERLWTQYVDFEAELGNLQNVEALFERLLERTKNPRVWISYAETLAHLSQPDKARAVYRRADEFYKEEGTPANHSRNELLQNWLQMEQRHYDEEKIEIVRRKLPREVKRNRVGDETTGASRSELGIGSEYVDYVFPDTVVAQESNMKLLDLAHNWKKQIGAKK